MQIENLFQPFQIQYMPDKDSCPIKPHQHTFFELVYTLSGEGVYHINENQFNFRPDNLFLLRPMDVNYCTVTARTSFLFIRFNNIYLNAQKPTEQHAALGDWIHKLEYILYNNPHGYGCIVRNKPDKPLVRSVIDALVLELKNQQTLHNELVQQLVNTLLTIVARNITLQVSEKTHTDQHVSLDIIHYIHKNIYRPEKLRAEEIASHFNISLNYISEYFKKHTNESLQQYITNYRLSLVEIRLRHSDFRVNEIAEELGFTDESHLTKTFKKYRGISPAEYRKSSAAVSAN
jgi:AraC-like DNA-binding protein